jgi:flagellar biosynthetic protein FliR
VIDLTPFMRFGLLLVRPGMLIAVSPGFGGTYAPARVKVGLTVLVAIALLPTVALPPVGEPLSLAVVVGREMTIGLALALAIHVLVSAAELAGHVAGFQMGLSYGATVDPQNGVRNPLLVVLYGNIAVVTFLAIDGHHAFLRALHQSYADLPIGTGGIGGALPAVVAQMLGTLFTVGVRLASPIVFVLLFVEIALALLARSAPALNLMVIGAPVRLIVGLLMLAVVVPAAAGVVAGASGSVLQLALRAVGALR